MPERAYVGDGVLAKHAELVRCGRPVVEKNIVGVGSKPTLFLTIPERAYVGDGVLAKHAEERGADVPI